MKRLALVLICTLFPAAAVAQQKPTPEQVRAMIEKIGPGPEHRTLAALEGRWSIEITQISIIARSASHLARRTD